MDRDAIATTHPIVQTVETVEQAAQAFDAISYSKGEAVIRMLEGYVGEDAWREGVRSYMKTHAYGNTASDDLWREVEAAARQPIIAIAHDFTLQPGVPMIRVESATCREGKTTLQLKQGEFTRDRPDKKPLHVARAGDRQAAGCVCPSRHVVTGGKATMTVPVAVRSSSTPGRAATTARCMRRRSSARSQGASRRSPRSISSAFFATAGRSGSPGCSRRRTFCSSHLRTPTNADPQVWGKIASVFDRLNEYYDGEGERQARLRTFAISRLAPVLERVGWTADTSELDTVAILRAQLIETLSALGDSKVIAEARRRYAAGDEQVACRRRCARRF